MYRQQSFRKTISLFIGFALALCMGCGFDGDNPTETKTSGGGNNPGEGRCHLDEGPMGAHLPAEFPLTSYGVQEGDTALDFTTCLKNTKKEEFHLYGFLGKVVFLNLGAGWCSPCRDETAEIERLYNEFRDEGLMVLMGLSEGWETGSAPDPTFLDEWSEQLGVTFPVLGDAGWSLEQYYRPNQVGGVPLNLVISRDGVIQYNSVGSIDYGQMKAVVQGAIDAPATLTY